MQGDFGVAWPCHGGGASYSECVRSTHACLGCGSRTHVQLQTPLSSLGNEWRLQVTLKASVTSSPASDPAVFCKLTSPGASSSGQGLGGRGSETERSVARCAGRGQGPLRLWS